MSKQAQRRIMREAKELQNATDQYHAAPLEVHAPCPTMPTLPKGEGSEKGDSSLLVWFPLGRTTPCDTWPIRSWVACLTGGLVARRFGVMYGHVKHSAGCNCELLSQQVPIQGDSRGSCLFDCPPPAVCTRPWAPFLVALGVLVYVAHARTRLT